MEVITMQKKENWIFGTEALEKIFRQNNEKTLFLFQLPGEKSFVPNQILKLLKRVWRKEIRKLGPLGTARRLGAEARNEGKDAKSYRQEEWVPSDFHWNQYIFKND